MRSIEYENVLRNMNKPVACVLGSYITGLGVIRSLGRRGIPIIGLDNDPRQIGFFSRYCIGVACPHPKNNEKEYVDFLMTLGEKLHERGVLIPTTDKEIPAILKNRGKLEKYYRFPMARLEVTEKILNKISFYKTLEKLDIPFPKTYFPNNVSEVKEISNEIRYPCIVKPAYSSYFKIDFQTKLFLTENREKLIRCYERARAKNHEVMVQEIIPGEASNMYGFNAYFDQRFKSKGIFMYRRIREWPHMFGNGCLIESVTVPELKDIITPLIKSIRYYGIVDAEFKKDPRDDMFKLLEINARPWMENSLPTRCGINLSYMAYMDAIGKDVENANMGREGVKWLFIFDDIMSARKNMAKGKLTVYEWIKSFHGEKEYAIFTWNDPLPFLVFLIKSCYTVLKYFLKRSNHGISE